LIGLFFELEDGSNTFLRNVAELLLEYMESHSRRYHSSEKLATKAEMKALPFR
jgi:hypothetical protein